MRNLLYFCLLLSGCTFHPHGFRDAVSLEGSWDFSIDSTDAGIAEKWYSRMGGGTVVLPGSMAENGEGYEVTLHTDWTGSIVDSSWFTGDEFEKYRQPDNLKIPFWLKPVKYYKGPAWYQREVVVPGSWMGRNIILCLERPHWESTVFINDREAGTSNSLAVPHRYDITPLVHAGQNRISIRIDNREVVPVGINSHSISDHTQSNWNGIVGKIQLESRNPVHIEDVQIYPEPRNQRARMVIAIGNQSGRTMEGHLELQATVFNSDAQHQAELLRVPVSLAVGNQEVAVDYPMGPGTRLWSEFSPALYNLEVTLSDVRGKAVDGITESFGMRDFSAMGTRFQVNGSPVFLRGTLECCIFPLTGYPPTDVASWEHVMIRCREHGLNHIRFHSWCPPEAAFTAADKHGIYLQVECSSWANQGTAIGNGGSLDSFIYEEGDRILRAYGNHPSFCMLAYGNEPAGEKQETYLGGLLEYWKSKDPRRVYTSGAGWPKIPENEYHNGPEPRIQHWGEGLGSIINAKPPQTLFDYREVIAPYHIPFVSHEIGQWCVYPDFQEMERYTGVLKPTNFEIFKEGLEEHHMGDQARDFLMASGKLQSICYKADIEAALRTPGFAGFQLLQLHDFPGQGTALVGILDPFFNSKGYISPEAFREFCSQTVPLARMEKRVFTGGETFRAGIEVAHFGEAPLKQPRIICQILNQAGEELLNVPFTLDEIPVDNAIEVGTVEHALGTISQAGKLILKVSLEGTPFSNSWDFWVYPEEQVPEQGEVWITDRLDDQMRSVLEQGGSVLLLTSGRVAADYGASVEIGFSSIFWNTAWTNGQAPHTLGILCDPDHPVFKDFPTEYHSNWQWWDPVTHSQAMILDHLPGELRPLIQPIHTWFANKKLGLAFEARSGKGKLLVCSIDLQHDLEKRPVSRQLLSSMLDYMNSPRFDPMVAVDMVQVSRMVQ